MNAGAQKMIARMGLEPLRVEGGFYRRTWLSPELRPDGRPTGSHIWYLIAEGDFSALHRLDAPERWEFQAGDPVEHVSLDPRDGSARVQTLGHSVRRGLVVPTGVWQGARLAACPHPRGWALLGCTMSPAWDEQGFEAGQRDALLAAFPAAERLVRALTR